MKRRAVSLRQLSIVHYMRYHYPHTAKLVIHLLDEVELPNGVVAVTQ